MTTAYPIGLNIIDMQQHRRHHNHYIDLLFHCLTEAHNYTLYKSKTYKRKKKLCKKLFKMCLKLHLSSV